MAVDDSILNDLKRTVSEIQDAVNGSIQESIDQNKQIIKELQTQEQMYQGIDSKGIDIKPAYANSTIKIKRSKGQPTDRVTLFDTGAFYNSLEIIAGKNDAIIRTIISYSVFLVDKYADILGLDDESWTKFLNNYTIPTLKRTLMILLQNPNMPVPTNAVEIDAAIMDIKAHLEAGLTWLTNGYGRTYKNLDATNGTTVFYPEAYLGEQNNSHRYINLSPDNDKQGQCFFYVTKENISQFQPGMYSYLSYDTAIIFSVNMELINDDLLQTDIFQQVLVAQVRDVLTRDLLGSAYQLSITSVDFQFDNVYSEFDLADAHQLEKAPLSHFRFNCTIKLPETCPTPVIVPIPPPPIPNMSLWLSGDVGVNGGAAINLDPVSIWADQSGSGNDFTQAVFINQPTFIESGTNGQSGISFTSPNFLNLLNADLFALNEGVIFVVCKRNAPSTGGQIGSILYLNLISHTVPSSVFFSYNAVDVFPSFPTDSYFVKYAN